MLYTNSIYGETKAQTNYITFLTLEKSRRKVHVLLWGVIEEGAACAPCNSNFVMAGCSHILNY